MIVAQRWPFGERFLDSALAEVTLPRGDERLDLARLAGLADRDQGDVAGVAPGEPGGLVDVRIGRIAAETQRCSQSPPCRPDTDLELEGGADVDGLAVAPGVLERRHAIMIDAVAHAAGHSDVPSDRVSAADIERNIVRLAQGVERLSVAAIGTNRHAAGKFAERVADANGRAFASAERRIAVFRFRDVAGDRETPPANRNAQIVAGGRQRSNRGSRAEASATCAWPAAGVRALIATRICDGRPLAAAGVNLKSVSDDPRPAKAAASRGSALAGVKVDTGSKLSATAAGRLAGPAARAGDSTRPAAANAVTSSAIFERPKVCKTVNSLFTSRYSYLKLKVP